MTQKHSILIGPFFVTLLATAFCIWSALGNDVNFCVTTGCTLYQDFSIAGISLWWIGTASFALLGALALLGKAAVGCFFSAIFLLGDICLLLLMALTAPCVSCLVAAFFFFLCYYLFHLSNLSQSFNVGISQTLKYRLLIGIWCGFFIINLALVARSQLDVWPILDESGEARAKMFFSPSCVHCIEDINVLSGNVDMAFYPVAENETDILRIARMKILLQQGMSLAEALGQSETGVINSAFNPEIMLLRFRLLRNKAHVFSAGSQGVPFFEYKGTPPEVLQKIKNNGRKSEAKAEASVTFHSNDIELPSELNDSGQCVSGTPCPPN